MDLMAHIRTESDRFTRVLAGADPAARVPSCPDWNALDLAWHLAQVHHQWHTVVEQRRRDPDVPELDRPEGMAATLELQAQLTDAMLAALAAAADDEAVWTWWPSEQHVGFIRRFQAHEALMHRVDAELAAGLAPSPLPADLAADGVLVALSYARAFRAADADWRPTGGVGRLSATDTGEEWTFTLGVWSGVDPWTGQPVTDAASIEVGGEEATFTVSGRAEQLAAWQWGRPGFGELGYDGDEEHARVFDELTAAGIP